MVGKKTVFGGTADRSSALFSLLRSAWGGLQDGTRRAIAGRNFTATPPFVHTPCEGRSGDTQCCAAIADGRALDKLSLAYPKRKGETTRKVVGGERSGRTLEKTASCRESHTSHRVCHEKTKCRMDPRGGNKTYSY